jgi:site-specific recombinase XerD
VAKRNRNDWRGWTLRRRSEGAVWKVRFRPAPGAPTTERSTGETDERAADAEAAKIVARARAGAAAVKRPRRGAAAAIGPLITNWLEWLTATHAATTIKTWRDYAFSHFIPFFGSTERLTSEDATAYQRARLSKVEGVTVRKEQSALRSLAAYALETGAIPEPMIVPTLPKRATGTSHPTRRRRAAPPLTAAETVAVIRRLDEWSSSKKVDRFPIRARFLVAYETGLRPSTLDRLVAPTHFRIGSAALKLDAKSVKERWARDVPLSRRARRILDYLLRAMATKAGPYRGPIFGWHNYREHIAAAAAKALPPDKAERFCAAHFRSAMITHSLGAGAALPAVQWLVGHTMVSTTARYVKPGYEAAAAAVDARRRAATAARREEPPQRRPPVAQR